MRSGHWLIFLFVLTSQVAAGPRYSSRIVETKTGPIRGIILELNSGRLEPVEAFLGVKYGSAARFGTPGPVPRWSSTKLADSQPPVCPQTLPDLSNRTAALQFMPKNRYNFLKRLAPLLANQTEDCLYLNIYVPGSDGTPHPEEVSNKKKKDKNKHSAETEDCDDEYMLQNIHKLKRFIRRVWNFAWCYTQYCYPGLRTAEYYKKVKRVCQEREKADKERRKKEKKDDKKKDKKKDNNKKMEHKNSQVTPMHLSTAAANNSLLSDISTQTSDEGEWSDMGDIDVDDNDPTSASKKWPKAKPLKHFVKPLKIIPALEEELGWGECLVKSFRKLSQTISNFMNETDQEYQIGAIAKVMCLLLAPAVMWLGVNYFCLRRKYKSLSGKLRRIKEKNDVLKKESSKLEATLSSTEKLKMPFSSKESKQQVVAEFTRLAESRMKSKKEVTRLTTEKQALLEELKTAKKQRDLARNQYSSLTQGVLETNHLPYLQT